VGAILKKSLNFNDTDAILPGESIDKGLVLLQIPEVLNDEAIQVLSCKKIEPAKRFCIISNPTIFKGEVLLRQKI
jgi:transposase-like protein